MLLSMTGHGSAMVQDDHVHVLAEIRSVNNRFLKVSVSSDLDAAFQSKIEAMVRENVQRGAVNVRIQLQFLGDEAQYQINLAQLNSYRNQLKPFGDMAVDGSLLVLPGVVLESLGDSNLDLAWPTVESAMKQALDKFVEMRRQEGKAMLDDLLENCDLLEQHNAEVKKQSPGVVENYASRVTERINRMLEEYKISVSTSELIKEIGIFTERVDTSEEMVRLSSHIEQFRTIANENESNGRKLDFLTQELLRETNTIGSKANDAQIAGHVVEMKTIIERIRENDSEH